MIRMIYLAILFIMIIAVIALIGVLHKRKDDVSRSIFILLAPALIAIIANAIYVMSDVESIAVLTHSIFLSCIDWLLLFMLRYVMVYMEQKTKKRTILTPLYAIATAESVSMLLNPVLHHVFQLEKQFDEMVGYYFVPVDYGFWFYAHLIFSYCIVIWIMVRLVYKIIKTPKIYRTKYAVIMHCFVAVVIFDAIGLSLKLPVDISLIFYCLACQAIYFFSVFYVPKTIKLQVMSMAVKMAYVGVGCFDFEGKNLFVNNRGKQMLRQYGKFPMDGDPAPMEEYFAHWVKENWEEGDEEKSTVVKFDVGYCKQVYEFTVQQLNDEKQRFLGWFVNCIDRTAEYEDLEEVHYRATHDILTGVYNEAYFEKTVAEVLRSNTDKKYVLLTLDVKDFKMVNDLFGMEKGDEVLKFHAQVIRKHAAEGVIYGRLRQEHFGVCMEKKFFDEQKTIDIMKEVEDHFTNEFFKLQIKAGVYEIQDIKEPVFVMIDKCNLAISRIKNDFSGRISVYDESMFLEEMEKNKVLNEFEGALARNEFVIFLQAQTTGKGEMMGAEALVRWAHPKKGILSPGYFVPILEQAGLIYRLDMHVWRLAAQQLAIWKKIGREDLHISVNISAQDQYHIDIYKVFTDLVEEYEIQPKNLKLEITESIFITEIERHLKLVKDLQEYGFEIEIDDFGSGYSSLNILKDISANVLKIDMGFLQKTENKERSREIVASIVELAKRLEMFVIVEGVETKEQLEILKPMNCDAYQGYYFTKPIPIEEFEEKYQVQPKNG